MESMPVSLSDQIKEIEQALLDLLIERSFDHCILDTGSRNLNIFEEDGQKVKHFTPIASSTDIIQISNPSEIIGIKSSPIDLANGRKCPSEYLNNTDVDADCSAVDGKLTLYLSDMVNATDVRNRMIKMINDIMDAKLLDECHQAILRVMFMNVITLRSIPDDDEYYQTEEVNTLGNRSMWMFATVGVVALAAIGVGTRYRYVSQFKSDGSGELKDNYENEIEDGSELFVEYRSSVHSSLHDGSMYEV